MTALEIRNRIRFAAAQQAWDDATPEDDNYDGMDDRYDAIQLALKALNRAMKHLDNYQIALCDQAMADAVGHLVP